MKKKSQKLLRLFRIIGIAEGISFLILLVIAMPLKYFFKIPEAVKVFGWLHGTLFVAFIYFGFEVMGILNKSFGWFFKASRIRSYFETKAYNASTRKFSNKIL